MSAVEQLIRQAMGSGICYFTEHLRDGTFSMFQTDASVTDMLGVFPEQFAETRRDLIDAVRAELAGGDE